MITTERLIECGGKAAAMKMHQDGQGQESNPFPKESKAWHEFSGEMYRLEQQELQDMTGWV